MQPTSEQPQPPYPAYDPTGYPPNYGSSDEGPGAPGGRGYEPAPPVAKLKRARPWRVAFVAFLTLLVLIAALGNQGVTDQIAKHARGDSFFDNAARAITVYQWRFTHRGNSDIGHVWLAQLMLVVAALVLTFLLVAAVVRGKGGFGQAFLGTWMSVVVSTLLATYVYVLVVDYAKVYGGATDRTTGVLFRYSAGAPVFFAGLVFGFVVALIAAITALISRRTEVITAPAPAAYQPGAAPPPLAPPSGGTTDREPWAAPPAAVPGPIGSRSPWTNESDQSSGATAYDPGGAGETGPEHTAVLPSVDASDRSADDPGRPRDDAADDTTALPRADRPTGGAEEQAPQPPHDTTADDTTAIPRSAPPTDSGRD